jgi:hypothetical protein
MKNSSIFGIFIIIIVIISSILLFRNEKANPRSLEDINKFTNHTYYILNESLLHSIEFARRDNRNRILIWGGISFILCSVSYFGLKKMENKKDPQKNLKKLRDNKIISDSEYEEKVTQSNLVLERKKSKTKQKKKSKKLILELQSLKDQGIISEREYNEKLIKIREKTA